MATGVKELMAAAEAQVPRISPARAREMVAEGGAVVVDVRDAAELAASGKVRGAVHIARGMLEFRADPELPSHHPELRRERPVILYCGSGGRAALAGRALKEMGYAEVYNLGGLKDWVESGGETDPPGAA